MDREAIDFYFCIATMTSQELTDLICDAVNGIIHEQTDDNESGTKTICDTPEKMLQRFELVSQNMRDRLTCFAFIPAAEWWNHIKIALPRFPRLETLYLYDVNNEVIDSIENMLLKGFLPCVTAIFFCAVDGKGFSSEYFVNENRFSGWIITESVWDTILDENDEPICLKMVLKPNIELSGELKNGA
jgi:hypothetical protein